jgi:hypothetical protein
VISLTGSAGYSSTGLHKLFDGGGTWSLGPQVSLPIFDDASRKANLGVSKANRDLALAQYEQAIQTACRETADALAVAQTVDDRIGALRRLDEDTSVTLNLSQERFRVGINDDFPVLDAQRNDYQSRQNLIDTERARALNGVALFRALGGGPVGGAAESQALVEPGGTQRVSPVVAAGHQQAENAERVEDEDQLQCARERLGFTLCGEIVAEHAGDPRAATDADQRQAEQHEGRGEGPHAQTHQFL